MKEKASFFTLGVLVGALCACAALAAWLFEGEGSAGSMRVLKLAHGLETSHPVHMGMEFMKKRVEELSGGTLSIDIYSGGALGSETKCLEQLKNGSLDMTKASAAQIGTFVPQMQILALPYIFRDSTHYWNALDSSVGQKFLDLMRDDGLVGLCYYDAGARSFYTTKKAVENPQDLRGLKIRVMNSRSDMDMIAAFGASPTPISAGETYTALAQGIVDGAENNPPTYYTSAHYEVAGILTLDEHTRVPDVLIIGEKSWNSLSPEQREILKTAALESSKYQRDLWQRKSDEAIEALKKKGVRIIQPDKSDFGKASSSVYKAYEGTDSGVIIDEIRRIK